METARVPTDLDGGHRRLSLLITGFFLTCFCAGLLVGCAARVDPITTAHTGKTAPAKYRIDVFAAPDIDPAEMETAQRVALQIRSELVRRLSDEGIAAEPLLEPGPVAANEAVLRVALLKTDPGNALRRFVVGFGLGSAELWARVDLEVEDSATDMHDVLAFATRGNSGYMPGLILPAGAALATRSVTHLAIGGGAKVATSLHDGLQAPAKQTAKAIVGQLRDYHRAQGWAWPSGR